MRRRKIEQQPTVPLFHGKRYATPEARQKAVGAWKRRRARLLPLVENDRDRSAPIQ